jgi:hypothetical protein
VTVLTRGGVRHVRGALPDHYVPVVFLSPETPHCHSSIECCPPPPARPPHSSLAHSLHTLLVQRAQNTSQREQTVTDR